MDYAARLQRLRTLLSALPCDALLIEDPINLLYLRPYPLVLKEVILRLVIISLGSGKRKKKGGGFNRSLAR